MAITPGEQKDDQPLYKRSRCRNQQSNKWARRLCFWEKHVTLNFVCITVIWKDILLFLCHSVCSNSYKSNIQHYVNFTHTVLTNSYLLVVQIKPDFLKWYFCYLLPGGVKTNALIELKFVIIMNLLIPKTFQIIYLSCSIWILTKEKYFSSPYPW